MHPHGPPLPLLLLDGPVPGCLRAEAKHPGDSRAAVRMLGQRHRASDEDIARDGPALADHDRLPAPREDEHDDRGPVDVHGRDVVAAISTTVRGK